MVQTTPPVLFSLSQLVEYKVSWDLNYKEEMQSGW